jgi:hypothetical protein
VRALSARQDAGYASLAGGMGALEAAQAETAAQLRDETAEAMRKQQSILNTLNKVAEKIDRLEMAQQPQLIYQPPRPPPPTNVGYQRSGGVGSRKCLQDRSHSADRVNRRRDRADKRDKRGVVSSTETFSKRLSGSVDRYFDRIKRDSVERRNVERFVVFPIICF